MSDEKELGVINTIQKFLDEVGTHSFTRDEIFGVLVQTFPDHERPLAMMATVKTQIPGKMSRERGYSFRNVGERFIVIPPKRG